MFRDVVSYSGINDPEEIVPLVHFSKEGHSKMDFGKSGQFLAFCTGGDDSPDREIVSRENMLSLAKMAHYLLLMNDDKNVLFIPAQTSDSSPELISALKKFSYLLKLFCFSFYTRRIRGVELENIFRTDGHRAISTNVTLIALVKTEIKN